MAKDEEENLNLGDSSSDGEFSDPLCVDVPTDDPLKLSGSSSSDEKEKEAPLETTTPSTPTVKKTAIIRCFQQWLAFYVKFCSSAGSQDKLLKVLQWSLWLLANTTITAGGKKSPNQRWMEFLSYEVSWARYVSRLLGFPVALEAAVNDSWALDKSSKLYRTIGRVLSYSMVAYHPLEALAYVQWRKPPSNNNDTPKSKWHQPERWSYLSCRFWLAYVAAELVQCILQWRTLQEQKRLLEQSKKKDESITTSVSVLQLNAQLSNTQLQTVRDALFLLPCLTWSLKNWDTKPLLTTHTVTTLMWAESIVSLYQAIRNQL